MFESIFFDANLVAIGGGIIVVAALFFLRHERRAVAEYQHESNIYPIVMWAQILLMFFLASFYTLYVYFLHIATLLK